MAVSGDDAGHAPHVLRLVDLSIGSSSVPSCAAAFGCDRTFGARASV